MYELIIEKLQKYITNAALILFLGSGGGLVLGIGGGGRLRDDEVHEAILTPLSTPLSKKVGKQMSMIPSPSPGRSFLASRAEKIPDWPC